MHVNRTGPRQESDRTTGRMQGMHAITVPYTATTFIYSIFQKKGYICSVPVPRSIIYSYSPSTIYHLSSSPTKPLHRAPSENTTLPQYTIHTHSLSNPISGSRSAKKDDFLKQKKKKKKKTNAAS